MRLRIRLPRISLATKYRILFGTAVVLIIGAALAVPWYTMEVLVLEQPFREAQRLAEAHFRTALPNPAALSADHSGKFSLLPEKPVQTVRFLPLDTDPEATTQPAALPQDSFLVEAVRFLRDERPDKEFYYRNTRDDSGRLLRYVHAVRVSRGCLNCHGPGSDHPFRENQLAGIIAVDLSAEQSGQNSLINRAVIIAAGGLAGILAVLVFYLISTRFILAPIDELRSVALKVADGDLSVRAAIDTGDEFEQLADNLNTMLERLRDSQEELRKANRLLDEKLEAIAETNVALYEANRVKSEFLANVSHELRTPLTSIIGFAELLREGPAAADSKTLRYAENILISGRILLEIINDLLDLAKIEANKLELKLEPVAVGELCGTLADFTRPLADKKRITLDLFVEDDLPQLITDRGRVRQILFNLVSNAIKFTPEGGHVWVRAEAAGAEHVRIQVRDTGPGIAKEHQQVIFEKFRQIDQSATREHTGTGLGLAIATELTMLLGGQIGVESELGHGATFTVTLPTAAPQPHVDRPLLSLT